jgi:hypothetical protein
MSDGVEEAHDQGLGFTSIESFGLDNFVDYTVHVVSCDRSAQGVECKERFQLLGVVSTKGIVEWK